MSQLAHSLDPTDLVARPRLDTGPLVLGPMLRRVGETTATIWVQVAQASTVCVHADSRTWQAKTFTVHGLHYAIVLVDGLAPGTSIEYSVSVDDTAVWPRRDVGLPPSRITTIDPTRPTRFTFGSCRTSDPHDEAGTKRSGIDAMRALAIELCDAEASQFPDLLVLLGDQVYADEITEAMQEFIDARRDGSDGEAPPDELADYIEYGHLYSLAWSEPFNRWLFSTVPSVMIFDDHDIRDDWNTSQAWLDEMNSLPWWHDRIVGGLASYWVYQHAGNLSHDELRDDEIYRKIAEHQESGNDGELDLTGILRAFAEKVNGDSEAYRWSYSVDLGDSRLLMIDSRAARVLTPGARAMLDPAEEQWLDDNMRGDVDHLFVGTSLPFLLIPGLHLAESLTETMTNGAWGQRIAGLGEKLRQEFDLEHWGAFERGFRHMFELAVEVSAGKRGKAPHTVTFLSGDVHNSYVAEVAAEHSGDNSRILQAVCSPIRNRMPTFMRMTIAHVAGRLRRPLSALIKRSKHIDLPKWDWAITHGPWFDNNIALVDIDGARLKFVWLAGDMPKNATESTRPRLRSVSRLELPSA